MTRASVEPSIISWALQRAGLRSTDLSDRFPKLELWGKEKDDIFPTFKQIEAFARVVHVPFGYLFLPEPPEEKLPIPDFRTMTERPTRRTSPNLLDTLYMTQERQDWYREFMKVTREPKTRFVGSLAIDVPEHEAAAAMAKVLDFNLDARAACRTWKEALRLLINCADRAGVLVMVSGVVWSNNRRRLDPQEFRGFALADDRAPLVFINGAEEIKASQMFTLAHGLAHLWLGTSALSDASEEPVSDHRKQETWCNVVAAEFLAPLAVVREELILGEALDETLKRLSRRFKVNPLVVLRRLLDLGWIDNARFAATWQVERARFVRFSRDGVGRSNFHRITLSRVNQRFARALVESTLEGQTLYRDAFQMLGITKTETFNNIARELEIMM